jgi:hypothetical protein
MVASAKNSTGVHFMKALVSPAVAATCLLVASLLHGDEGAKNKNADPDQPPMRHLEPDLQERIDGGDYIRLRDLHIARLRGWEPGKPFDFSARAKAIRQMEMQESLNRQRGRLMSNGIVAQAAFPIWSELGPNPIPNGATSPVNPTSGRVTAIEVDPTDPNKVYAGTAQGGVFRSLDGGTTWTAIFDSAQSLAIGALALDAANGRLYVGTGEPNSTVDSFAGVGLYRIDNVNAAAILVGPINPIRNYNDGGGSPTSAAIFTGRSISKILIVPNDPNTLFVGVAGGQMGIGGDSPFGGSIPPLGLRGLYRLSGVTGAPGSVTVTRVTVSTAAGCFDTPCTGNRNINDMVFDPVDSTGNTLIVWQNGISTANDGGVFRSTNAMSGSPAFTQTFATTATSSGNGRGGLAIYKSGANPAVVYVASGEPATGTSCSSGNGALRVSTDGGVTFSAKLTGGGGFCGGQCFYNIGFAVNPGATTALGDDIILLGGNVGSGMTNCSRLNARSTNGGSTFAESNGGIHPDTHVLKMAPSNSNIAYRGDDGGIFKSIDGGVNWTSLNNSTFKATQFQSLALHPTDQNFTIGGTQDNGTLHYLPNGTWNFVDFGDGGYSAIDQNAADTSNVVMYHTYFNQTNNVLGYARVPNVAAAVAGNWDFYGCQAPFSANGITCGDAVLFYAPLVLGPGNPNAIYYGTDRLYRSIDQGGTNTVVSQTPLVPSTPISSIAVSALDDNYRIVGLSSGALFYTIVGSSSLSVLDATGGGGTIPDKYIARIKFDPVNKNIAYIALGGYMASTTSANSHVWRVASLNTTPVITAINGAGATGLPDVPVNGLAMDPQKTSRLFAGTDIGVYVSEDTGATWAPFGLGLPRVAVFDMEVQNAKRVLRIATHGRGLWEIGIPASGTVIVNPPSNVAAIATTSTNIQVTWTAVGNAASYQIWRSSANSAYAQVGTTASTLFNDPAAPNTTYLYKIKSVDGSANVSPLSNFDYATTVLFNDDPIVTGTTPIKAIHLAQLRTAVNAMQTAAGVTPSSFTDPTLNNTIAIKAVHITQLRTALATAISALAAPTTFFTNSIAGTVKAADVQEIRNAVK